MVQLADSLARVRATWSLCLDARGLVSGSSSDGHGAVVWETSFTRTAFSNRAADRSHRQ